jgi:cation diffusion facilitator family transporter
MKTTAKLMKFGLWAIAVNITLMFVKIIVGIVGNSYALIADGIESASDIVTSIITWSGVYFSLRPADNSHPYGHGKIESLAGAFSGVSLLLAAAFIGFNSYKEIVTPHHAPSWFTLPVLILVVIVKEVLSRKVLAAGNSAGSQAIKGDAWHHRSDAITSAAAAIGIGVALIGGNGYEMADDWAALLACIIITINGVLIIKSSLHDVLDGAAGDEKVELIKAISLNVEGVKGIEKIRVRRSGMRLIADMHIRVPANKTVVEGHAISHIVKDKIVESGHGIDDIVIHIEPENEA